MKRAVVILAMAGLMGVGLAQAPEDDGLPEDLGGPPIRLKKKGRDNKVEEPKLEEKPELKPEEKPEKPEENPPEIDEPEIEPPKLEEDNELQELDDLQPQDESAEILDRIAKNTRNSEERLANEELGEGTRQVQQDILNDLDKLIETQQNNQQNNQGGGGQAGQGGQQQRQKGRQGRSGSRLTRNKERGGQGGRQGNQDQKQLTRNDPKPGPGAGHNPQGGNGGPQGDKPDPDRELDLWGHLPERERMLMNKYMREKFMQKYEQVTEEYYRRLAEKSRGR